MDETLGPSNSTMSRRRKKMKEIEVQHLIEAPPSRRPGRETSRVLDLLDQIASEKPNKEDQRG
jgi:hypothetical protein